jgi:hypothetical protein
MGGDQTRRELLLRGASAGAAGLAGTAGAALLIPTGAEAAKAGSAHPSSAHPAKATPVAPASPSDIDRLQRLLSVEQLLLYCYTAILSSRVSGPRMHRALDPLRAQEQAHVAALTAAVRAGGGSPPPPPPSSDSDANHRLARRKVGGRLGQLKGAKDALRLLLTLEQVTVGVYFVALTKLEDPQLIMLATSIMANEAQHETMINLQLNHGNAAVSVPYGLVQGLQ